MPTIEDAIRLALDVHTDQKDKAGKPYILHPIRVMMRMETDEEMTVAILHDVVEDSVKNGRPVTLDMLRIMGYPEKVVAAIDRLSKREGEPYEDFIARAAADPLAARVKMADLRDNMNMERIDELRQEDFERYKKYRKALSYLEGKAH